MKELRTEIVVQALPEMVWLVLTELDKWTGWNPFTHRAVGKAKVGEKAEKT